MIIIFCIVYLMGIWLCMGNLAIVTEAKKTNLMFAGVLIVACFWPIIGVWQSPAILKAIHIEFSSGRWR